MSSQPFLALDATNMGGVILLSLRRQADFCLDNADLRLGSEVQLFPRLIGVGPWMQTDAEPEVVINYNKNSNGNASGDTRVKYKPQP